MTPLQDALRELVAEIAELDPADVDLDTPFEQVDVDSLMAMEIAVHAEGRFGVRYDEASLIRATTLRALAALTEERLGARR